MTVGRAAPRLVAAAVACAALGCRSGRGSGDAPAASTSRPETTGSTAAHPDGAGPPRRDLPCRAVGVDGDIRADGQPLAPQAEIPADWLNLGPGARLVARDPRTTRETTFFGPGRARACVGAREESWLASGRFESGIGAGESPGAEEWLATPLAAVRYGAAKLRIDVSASGTAVWVSSGAVFLWRAAGARAVGKDGGAPGIATDAARPDGDPGWTRLAEGNLNLAPIAGSEGDVAQTAVDRCTSLARDARDLAASLLSPTLEKENRAATVVRQVETRRLARAACAVAALRVVALGSAKPSALSERLAEAEDMWRLPPSGAGARTGDGAPR